MDESEQIVYFSWQGVVFYLNKRICSLLLNVRSLGGSNIFVCPQGT